MSGSDPDRGPRYGLLLVSLVGLGVIAASAPSGCRDRVEGAVEKQAQPVADGFK